MAKSRIALTLIMALALAACGADGEPERPDRAAAPGLSITGSVEVGVTGSH